MVGYRSAMHSPLIWSAPPTYSILYDQGLDSCRTWGHIILSEDGLHFYCWFGGPTTGDRLVTVFQKRLISDGSLVWSRTYTGAGIGSNNYNCVYLYNGNLYAVGSYQSNGWQFSKFTENNANVWSSTELAGGPYAGGGAIYADSSGVYIAYYNGVVTRWRVQKWTDANPPILVWTQDRNIGLQPPNKIIADETGNNIILIGGNGSAIYEKRLKSDGTLLFSGGWAVGGANAAFDLTPSNSGIFYVGGNDFGDPGVDYRARYEKVNSSDLTTSTYEVNADLFFGGRNTTSGITVNTTGTYIYGVQGYPAGSPAGGQTKLVRRKGSDLSFDAEVNLGDASLAGVSNLPGIKYIPSDGVYDASLIIISHDYSAGPPYIKWKIQRRRASDLGV